MAEPVQNSESVLCGEILAEARRKSDEVARRARAEAEAILVRGTADAEAAHQARLARARGEGGCWTELALAIVPVEAVRRRAARIEEILQSVYAEARRRLEAREGLDLRATVVGLAAECIRGMTGEAFVVTLSAADRAALGEGLAEAIRARVQRAPLELAVADDPGVDGGVIVQARDGRQVWDARLLVRLDRLWPELRQQLAALTGLVASDRAAGGSA